MLLINRDGRGGGGGGGVFSHKTVPPVFADKKANNTHAQDLLSAGNRSSPIALVAIATESTKAK